MGTLIAQQLSRQFFTFEGIKVNEEALVVVFGR